MFLALSKRKTGNRKLKTHVRSVDQLYPGADHHQRRRPRKRSVLTAWTASDAVPGRRTHFFEVFVADGDPLPDIVGQLIVHVSLVTVAGLRLDSARNIAVRAAAAPIA